MPPRPARAGTDRPAPSFPLRAVYQANILSYGFVPGIIGFVTCLFLPLYVRGLPPLLMLATTIWAVIAAAPEGGAYVVGCAVYAVLSAVGLYARARRKGTSLAKQRPYDLALAALLVFIAALAKAAGIL